MSHVCDTVCWNFSYDTSTKLWPVTARSHAHAPDLALYNKLSVDDRAIRLVHILPGNYKDDLELELHVASLSDSLNYKALSYCWGKDVSPRVAWVNGHRLIIGTNLDCALRHLRAGVGALPNVIWIDAICINQTDLEERAQQVQLMGSIYSTASRVLIWLGPGSPGFDPVFDCMRRHAIPASFELRQEGLWLLRCLTILCQNAWFSRVWILQEMLLALEDPHICVGNEHLSWSTFHDFVLAVIEQAGAYTNLAATNGDATVPWPTAECRELIVAARQLRLMGMLRRGGATTTIDRQISRTQYAQATDARDKVYGLLGICRFDDDNCVVPDYDKSASLVFKEVMMLSMIKYRRLVYNDLPLHPTRAGACVIQVSATGKSTWVVDLTNSSRELGQDTTHRYNQPLSLIPVEIDIDDLLADTHGRAPLVRFTTENNILETYGEHLGTVSATTGALLNSDDQETWSSFIVPAAVIYDIYHDLLAPRGFSVQQFYYALSRSQDNHRVGGRSDLEIFEDFLKIRVLQDHPSMAEGGAHYILAGLLAITCRNRTLFITQEGHIGMSYHLNASEGIRPGDVLTGLFGVRMPFLLRRKQQSVTASRTEYLGSVEQFQMINVARVAEHTYGHDFMRDGSRNIEWQDWTTCGLRQYTIV